MESVTGRRAGHCGSLACGGAASEALRVDTPWHLVGGLETRCTAHDANQRRVSGASTAHYLELCTSTERARLEVVVDDAHAHRGA